MECQGCIPLDPDEVNDMVADRDPHALEFFGLSDMSDEELDEWDAHNVDMPTLSEFDPDFEPYSPFDEGWSLNVEYINPNEDEELTQAEAIVSQLHCPAIPDRVSIHMSIWPVANRYNILR